MSVPTRLNLCMHVYEVAIKLGLSLTPSLFLFSLSSHITLTLGIHIYTFEYVNQARINEAHIHVNRRLPRDENHIRCSSRHFLDTI